MGEQIKLLCSETSPINNRKDLKEIFINRFKLPDDFWNNLFDSNCPEGLGKVNEKLRNGEDLSTNDFKSLDDSSVHEDAQHDKNKQNSLEVKKTPILIKSQSNANHSPSLFSPLPQNLELQKGPTSSTPLPGKPVCAATFTITPKTTKNNAQNDYWTPENKLLGYIPYNSKSKSQKLSASLAMDPLEQMNLSWSSSLATPPGSACPKQLALNTKNSQSTPDKTCSSELREIQLDESHTIRIVDPLDELSTIKVESKSKPKFKGVARILFENEINHVRADLEPGENPQVNQTEKQSQNNLLKSVSGSGGHEKICDVRAANNDSVSHFDMSCLSPLQETAINELFMLVDTCKSQGGMKVNEMIKSTADTKEEKSTPKQTFDNVDPKENNVTKQDPGRINGHLPGASEINPIDSNITNENARTEDDFKNLTDVDASSEFPVDPDSSEFIAVARTSNHGETENVDNDNALGLTTNMVGPDLVRDGKTEPMLKSSIIGPDVGGDKICLTDQVSKPPDEFENLYDMESELPMDFDISQNITEPSLHPDNNLINNDSHNFTNKSTTDIGGRFIEQNKNLEENKQSKTILSLQQNRLPQDEVNKTLYDEQNDKLKMERRNCQNAMPSSPFVGFSTASGKKVTISDKSMQRARKLLNEVNLEEKNSLPMVNVDVRKNVGDPIGTRQINEPIEKVVSNGFCTASGKKVEVSMRSLHKARQILQDVIQEESEESKDVKKSVEVLDNGVTSALQIKCKKPKLVSNNGKVNEKERGNLIPYEQRRQFTTENGVTFSCAAFDKETDVSEKSLVEAKLILNDFEHMPELSEDFLKDVDKVFANLDGKPCLSKGDEKQGDISKTNVNEGKEGSHDIVCTKEGRDFDDRGNNDCSKEGQMSVRNIQNIEITHSESPVSNEGSKAEQSQRKMANGKCNEVTKSKPEPFTNVLENDIIESETLKQNVRMMLDDNENKECSTSENKTTVCEESLKKAQISLNEVENDQSKRSVANNRPTSIPCFTSCVKGKHVGFSTASGKDVAISEASVQKAKIWLRDKENVDCSWERTTTGNIPKFACGFSTTSGKEISVSEESLKKAGRILNEVDNEECRSEIKTVNEKHNACSTTSSAKANVGFTTASGNTVTVSEASIKKARRMLDDKLLQDETSSRTAPNFGFSTASGNEIVISEESLKKARSILNEVDKEECRSEIKTVNQKHSNHFPTTSTAKADVGFTTASGNTVTVSEASIKKAKRILDDGNCDDHKKDVKPTSTTAKEDISKSSVSCTTRSPSQEKTPNGNDIECQKMHKRLSSEIETENDRVCKAARTGKETKNDEDKWTRSKRFDPLVTYKDRTCSNSPSPFVMVSSNLENAASPVMLCDQSVGAKTPSSKAKSGSHFVTPYRVTMTKQGRSSENTPSNNANMSSCLKSGGKKTKNVDQKNKNRSVKPQPGSMYKLRTNSTLKSKRISFAEYVSSVNQQNFHESETHEVSPSVILITSENAESYRFKGSEFLSEDTSAKNTGVTLTEGAVLFPGEDNCIGLSEITKAFLASPGVDPKLISEEWIANHYKWIVWKLASYERSYPQAFSGRSLTPDMVLSQLKYRYDREVDHCERSAIKKILERDDSASRSMVLCVASLNVTAFDRNNESNTENQTKNVQPQKVIQMTDSWYGIRVHLDEYLHNLVRERKIYVGQKLYIQCAELCGSDQAVSPLEAPSNLYLRIHGNSTRPAKKFSRLGFHCKNNIFSVPIKSISTVGGLVSCISVIAVRQYPLQFMEKLPDGKCIFRNPRCEERVAKKFEDNVQKKREKIIAQVEMEIDKEELQTTIGRKSNSLSTDQILSLSDGKQIFDAISNADDPFRVQKCLSDDQIRILHSYKENLHNDQADIVRRKYEKAWSRLSKEETLKREVVPVLKVKLVDSFPPVSQSNQTPGAALLTVWRPHEQTITTLGEGKRLKIYNVQVSKYKGNNLVQLSANRATIYRAVNSISTGQNEMFEARKVFTLREISKGLRPNVEVDVVAVVISCTRQHNLTLVYVADSDLNLLRIKVWGGLEVHCLQDVMKERNLIAACNLLSQPDNRSGIPSLKYYELSLVTSNPSNKKLRNSLYELRKAVANPDSIVTKAKAKLNELCHSSWSTPKVQNVSLLNGTSSESTGKRQRTADSLMQNMEDNIPVVGTNGAVASTAFTPLSSTITPRQNESLLQSRRRLLLSKRRKLDLLADPSPISPIPNALPASVRKAFQVPRRIRTQVDNSENEEE